MKTFKRINVKDYEVQRIQDNMSNFVNELLLKIRTLEALIADLEARVTALEP